METEDYFDTKWEYGIHILLQDRMHLHVSATQTKESCTAACKAKVIWHHLEMMAELKSKFHNPTNNKESVLLNVRRKHGSLKEKSQNR